MLPDVAQKVIESCKTRCDFYYQDRSAAIVFIDGPPHDEPGMAEHDAEISDCLSHGFGVDGAALSGMTTGMNGRKSAKITAMYLAR